ncbi:MAG: hypothetical protein ACOYT4_03670 [Nanoarchaeota archaeon]
MKKENNPSKTEHSKKLNNREVQELLIENFVGLQKAMTNLSIKFEGLTEQITKLLEIYELSAKNFLHAKSGDEEDNKDLLNKINSLLDQNKTIAKGLLLIEGKLKNQMQETEDESPIQRNTEEFNYHPKPLPRI